MLFMLFMVHQGPTRFTMKGVKVMKGAPADGRLDQNFMCFMLFMVNTPQSRFTMKGMKVMKGNPPGDGTTLCALIGRRIA